MEPFKNRGQYGFEKLQVTQIWVPFWAMQDHGQLHEKVMLIHCYIN